MKESREELTGEQKRQAIINKGTVITKRGPLKAEEKCFGPQNWVDLQGRASPPPSKSGKAEKPRSTWLFCRLWR